MASLRPGFFGPAIWVGLEAFGGSVFSSVGLLVIAALIGPSDLGLSAIALGIIQAVNFFPDTLFHDAIIQRQRLTVRHTGSAFWSVTALSVVLAACVVASAPLAARLYGQAALSALLIVLAGSSICTAVTSIQTARLRRAMRFRALAQYAIVSRALATIVGLVLALAGFGAWAIIAQYGLGSAILAVVLLFTTQWRFIGHFSFAHAREIGVFACARTAVHFVDLSRGSIFFAVLGHYLPLDVLGQVNLAFRLVESLTKVVCTAISRLFLPIFSRFQQDPKAMTVSLRQAASITAAFLVPVFVGLALTAGDLLGLFASSKWQGMDGLVPWLCVAGIVIIIQTPAGAAILAVGRPMLISFGASGVLALLLIELFAYGPTTGLQAIVCWTLPLLAGVPIYSVITRRAVGLGYRAQFVSLIPAILITSMVAAATLAAGQFPHAGSQLVKAAGELVAAGVAYLLAITTFVVVYRQRPQWAGVGRLLPSDLSKETS